MPGTLPGMEITAEQFAKIEHTKPISMIQWTSLGDYELTPLALE